LRSWGPSVPFPNRFPVNAQLLGAFLPNDLRIGIVPYHAGVVLEESGVRGWGGVVDCACVDHVPLTLGRTVLTGESEGLVLGLCRRIGLSVWN
jgi:hypothetical protein